MLNPHHSPLSLHMSCFDYLAALRERPLDHKRQAHGIIMITDCGRTSMLVVVNVNWCHGKMPTFRQHAAQCSRNVGGCMHPTSRRALPVSALKRKNVESKRRR